MPKLDDLTDQQLFDWVERERKHLWEDLNLSVGSRCAPLLFSSIEQYTRAMICQYHREVQNLEKLKNEE